MDDADYADGQTQAQLDARIKDIRSHKLSLSNPGRRCWSCGFTTESDLHRWCCVECTRAWELEN